MLLYRTSPKRDLRYLIQAASDAYSLSDNQQATRQGWAYGCDFTVLYKFENPVTRRDIGETRYLRDWGAYTSHFRHKVFGIPTDQWRRLKRLITRKNPGCTVLIRTAEQDRVNTKILLEEQLEDDLVQNLGVLRRHGYNLRLYTAEDGTSGRQFVCKGGGGRIDLLCYDKARDGYVVIELKNVQAGQNTFAQVASYMGWVKKRIAKRKPVIGLVISRGHDIRFENCLRLNRGVHHLDLTQLGFE